MWCYNGAMNSEQKIRVVLDTNVVFEGLTKQGGESSAIIDAWFAELIIVCVTNAVAYEYFDVLTRKLSARRIKGAIETLVTLLESAELTTVNYSWRPSSPDPGDECFIDCTMNANALLVTFNIKDFRLAQFNLGMKVRTPEEFLEILANQLGEK